MSEKWAVLQRFSHQADCVAWSIERVQPLLGTRKRLLVVEDDWGKFLVTT